MTSPDPYEVGQAVLDRLMAHNEERKSQGMARREKIRQIIDAEPELSAREVQEKLRNFDTPSLRTVQWHLQNIRATRRRCADT